MMTRFLLPTLFCFGLIFPTQALAQSGIVTGRVVDEAGATVPGVNIALQGTTIGTASDLNGEFEFLAPPGSYTLVATFVGYDRFSRPITIVADQPARVEIELSEARVNLDEVVVTALGIAREQRSIGYSVQEVEPDLLQRADESNLVNALAGKVAGVQINSSSGQPGKSSRMTIRGVSSMLGDNQPLFVIDGVPISNAEDEQAEEFLGFGSTLFTGATSNRGIDIDPNIIEDVTVLKGASATALYGSRAANGAVVITTRRANLASRGPSITFSSKVRWDDAVIEGYQTDYLQGINGYFLNGHPLNRGGYIQPGAVNVNGTPITNPVTTGSWGPHRDSVDARVLSDLNWNGVPVFDPRADFYRTAAVLDNSLSISGGTSDLNYLLTVSNLNQEGTVPGTQLDRTSILAKFGGRLSSRLDVESAANYIKTYNVWLPEGNGSQAYLYGLNFTPISFDITEMTYPDESQRMFHTRYNNPFWIAQNNNYSSDVDRLIGSTLAAFKMLPWLTLSERLGIDTYGDTRKNRTNIGTRGNPAGEMYDQKITRTEINSDLTLQADRDVSSRLNIQALVGHNLNRRYYQWSYVRGQELGVPDFFNVSNASTVNGYENREERLLSSVYSQVTLDYDRYAYLTLTGRNDWSSTLPAGENSYFYPSASLGFVFTELFAGAFDRTPLSFGKARASVAQIGSDAPVYSLATSFVQAAPGDGTRGEITYPFNGYNGFKQSNILGNPDLKPEISTEVEFGLDLRFFGQRARLDAAYYDRSTRNQIFDVPVSAATGYVRRLLNAGEIRNYGYELTLGLTPIDTRNVIWDIQANLSNNTTEVVELAEGVESIYLSGFESPQIQITAGKDGYGAIFGSRFLRNEEGRLLIDEDGYPLPDDELGVIGNVMPDWVGNFRSSLTYKNVSLSALVDVRQGGDIMNLDATYTIFYGTHIETANRGTYYLWDGVNQTTGRPNTTRVLRDESYYRNFYSNTDENYVEDGSFVKLREVSLAYTIPRKWSQWARLQSASLTATGRNLWIRSDFSYGDPEGSLIGSGNGQGYYHMVTPNTRSWSLGVRVTL